MRLNIDSNKLELLLEKKRDYIGKKYGLVGLIEALLLALSAYTESYDGLFLPSVVIKSAFVIIAIIEIIYFIKELVKPRYTKDDLLHDIKALDITHRTSSIVAIKNPSHPTQFLLYYDSGWQMELFPNFATVTDDAKNVKTKLGEQLDAAPDSINIKLKVEGHEEKYSTEHKENRDYFYRIYHAEISGFGHEDDSEFEIEGRKYRWMTVDEMLSDEMIKDHNSYVVGLVRDHV